MQFLKDAVKTVDTFLCSYMYVIDALIVLYPCTHVLFLRRF